MTPNSIITAVRKRLGDTITERWDDQTLLLYVSLCQNDICTFTRFYRKTTTITLIDNQLLYDLPSDCLAVNRLEYNCKVLPMESRNTIDAGKAVFPCVLKDNVAFNQLEFVLSKDGDCCSTLFGMLTETYGVVTASDTETIVAPCELEDIHGVVVDVEEDTTDDDLCDELELLVYYTAVPPQVLDTEMDDPLIVPDIWFQAFLHFVGGMALQDDNDANNIQRGELEGQKYLRYLNRISQITSKDFTSNIPSKLTTDYRGGAL